LQSVLVAPVSRGAVVLGKIAGGTTLALIQGGLFLALAPTVGIFVPFSKWFYVFFVLTTMSFGLTGLGFLLAWRLNSSQGFHAVMNLFLIPMWLLSGALFPVSGAPTWLRMVMTFNPLTYGIDALRGALVIKGQMAIPSLISSEVAIGVIVIFAVLMFLLSWLNAKGNDPFPVRGFWWGLLILTMVGITTASVRTVLMRRNAGELPVYSQIANFKLTNQHKTEVTLDSLEGKPWVADFIFTECTGQCPILSRQMAKLQQLLPEEANIKLVSFSVDPETDTPEVLADYGDRFGAEGDRWWFLTGSRQAIYDLSKDSFKLAVMAAPENKEEPILHSAKLIVVDAKGQIRGYYDGNDEKSINNIIRDLGKLTE